MPRLLGKALILDILRDLRRLHALYPTMRIVWSTIIPCLNWRGARDVIKVNKARRQVNREVCRGVRIGGFGSVIDHHGIQVSNREFFRSPV